MYWRSVETYDFVLNNMYTFCIHQYNRLLLKFLLTSRNHRSKQKPQTHSHRTRYSHTETKTIDPTYTRAHTHSHTDTRSADSFTSIRNPLYSNKFFFFNCSGGCAHAQQLNSSYQSAKQSNGERINTSDTVEYALSKGTATEICIGSTTEQPHHCCRTTIYNSTNLNNNNQHTSNTMSENRDRLGLWGTASVDSEVAGNISGLQRLHLSRFNKVSAAIFFIYLYFCFSWTWNLFNDALIA